MKNLFSHLAASFLVLSLCHSVSAAEPKAEAKKLPVQEKKIEYKEGETVLEGTLFAPKNAKKGTPLVVVVHDWLGTSKYDQDHAKALAEMGYIAFAADIYGKGVKIKDAAEAAKTSSIYKDDRALMRKRIEAAITTATHQPNVDAKRVAVIGYCFGGAVALESARANLPVIGVASFHGALASPTAKDSKTISAKVIAFHGAEDPYVKEDEVKTFQNEMRAAKADWQFISYSGAVHSFTKVDAGLSKDPGQAYNANADHRSWTALQNFLSEIFNRG